MPSYRRDLRGFWWPDGPQSSIDELLRASGPEGSIILMHFYGETDSSQAVNRFEEYQGVYETVRRGNPTRHILLRAYLDANFGWEDDPQAPGGFRWRTDPVWWAERIVSRLARFESPNGVRRNLWADPWLTVFFANEPNLHQEHRVNGHRAPASEQHRYHSQAAYERIARWHLAVFERVESLLGSDRRARIGTSPFAQGHDPHSTSRPEYAVPDGEYLIPAVKEMCLHPVVGLVCQNVYGHGDRDDGRDAELEPWKWFGLWRPLRPEGWKNANENGVRYPDPGGLVSILAAWEREGYRVPLAAFPEIGLFCHDKRGGIPSGRRAGTPWADWTEGALTRFLEAAAATRRVGAACSFIWDSFSDHSGNRINPSPELRAAFLRRGPIETVVNWPDPRTERGPIPPDGGGGSDMRIVDRPSSHSSSRSGYAPRYIIIHSTVSPAGATPESTARYLERNDRGVSVHEYVAEPALVYRMVPDERAAHHAESPPDGQGRPTVVFPGGERWDLANEISWGIEGYQTAGLPMSGEIAATVLERTVEACRRFSLGASRVLGHGEISPSRRSDPVGIDMERFRSEVERALEGGGSSSLERKLAEIEVESQVVELNPDAALQKAISNASGDYQVTGPEVSFEDGGKEYVGQRAEDLRTGDVRVYYVEVGDWGRVRHWTRPPR